MQIAEPRTAVKASLNYAADRSEGGIWSNATPSLRTQSLRAHEVDMRDARKLSPAPSVRREGFEHVDAPVGSYDWKNENWVQEIYLPHCIELVKKVTGADYVTPMQPGILIRDTGNSDSAPAADFVHLDQSRESVIPFLEGAVPEDVRSRYGRTTVFNVWRAVTPPPQDVPLALCDQRTLDEADWVIGNTIEPNVPHPIPYVSSIYNPGQKWYYFSDLTSDEALVFKNYDSDTGNPMGCLHGAFALADVAPGAVPRASAETRILAFFE